MQEFLLVIHRDLTSKKPVPTPEQMQAAMQPYKDWIGSIAAKDRLVAPPKRWDADGRFITHGKVKNHISVGPFAEDKLSIGGLFLIRANDYDEAVELAKGCPIIQYGAIVEVRLAVPAA
ncbi:YciI family protein [Terrimonas sp. NA20]|uniref:YciI family protein n=1 Tax=Terrimonas ginsenosidimutans TaxID=2908004 RepID=A0ABS9KUE0_9BACT|nr:YciI family protein [Terrimonas ginsenosidimutans]MCG2615933.1 YciI family protein [Terrimonas ginsenosidimutans]